MTLTAGNVRDYLGPLAGGMISTPASNTQIERALAAEKALQARACRVPADDDVTPEADATRAVLEEALLRRVVVNLARRALPLGMQMSDAGAARISTNDPEVRRLEGPYRKLLI